MTRTYCFQLDHYSIQVHLDPSLALSHLRWLSLMPVEFQLCWLPFRSSSSSFSKLHLRSQLWAFYWSRQRPCCVIHKEKLVKGSAIQLRLSLKTPLLFWRRVVTFSYTQYRLLGLERNMAIHPMQRVQTSKDRRFLTRYSQSRILFVSRWSLAW